MKMPVNKSGAIFAALLIASCSQGPTAPTKAPTAAKVADAGDGRVSGAAAGDVKNGPIEINLVRVTQTDGVPLFFASPGGTYTIRPNLEVEIYVQIWTTDTALAEAPRLIVDWGVGGGVDERDRIHCGPCRLSRTYSTGRYTVTVTMDDRVGGVTSRTFTLNVANLPPEVPDTPSGLGTFNGTLDASDPQFDRFDGSDFAPPATEACSTNGDLHYYETYAVHHLGGPLRIETVAGPFDTYLNVFSGSFNPANACQNIVASDDDGGAGLLSLIQATFPPGDYIVVVTSYSGGVAGSYTLLIQ